MSFTTISNGSFFKNKKKKIKYVNPLFYKFEMASQY